jgi:hypothetical protein
VLRNVDPKGLALAEVVLVVGMDSDWDQLHCFMIDAHGECVSMHKEKVRAGVFGGEGQTKWK